MSKFISRKELEVRHSRSYEMRGRLKELGCEWDGIARAWIAPTTEVKELCYQILEEQEEKDNSPRRAYFGSQWDIDYDEAIKMFDQVGEKSGETERAKSIAHEPTREEVEKIVGSENVLRYWRDDMSSEISAVLASGELNKLAIEDRLISAGWKTKQIATLFHVVDHLREHPPIPSVDEVATADTMLSVNNIDAVPAIEMDGSIGVIYDTEGTPVKFTVKFPYSHQMVNRIKWMPGRRWNEAKKRWEVPIESKHAGNVLENFPHFQRSPKAKELEGK